MGEREEAHPKAGDLGLLAEAFWLLAGSKTHSPLSLISGTANGESLERLNQRVMEWVREEVAWGGGCWGQSRGWGLVPSLQFERLNLRIRAEEDLSYTSLRGRQPNKVVSLQRN